MPRPDGREPGQMRPVRITRNYIKHAEGSCLIEVGDTRVICTASLEDRVPLHRKNTATGWVSAEYGMLPRSCSTRTAREVGKGPSGRTHEIQRLIGRSLRSVVNMNVMGERTIWIDCDVIQADGGTRTASITGGYVALFDAVSHMMKRNLIRTWPITDAIAAVSVGIVGSEEMLDLCYSEDSTAMVDMNIVMTGRGRLVEVQGTAEGQPFSREQMDRLIDLGSAGVEQLIRIQKDVLGVG